MDIVDILLAKALTPQGQVETYAAKAQKAAQDATAARNEADAAVEAISSITEQTNTNNENAAAAYEQVQAALEALENVDTLTVEDVDAEIKKMQISRSQITSNAYQYYENLHITYPDGTTATIPGTVQLNKSTGTSEIEGMTQKAITDALNTKANTSILNDYATKSYVTAAISNIPSSGGSSSSGSTNLGSENKGKLVIIGQDGNIIPGVVDENDFIEILMRAGGYNARNAVGLEVDYNNHFFKRTQEAIGLNFGSDFNSYVMYGGRKRCNVLDNGTITAFYGDNDYIEDGTNGQVMVYQPKFYYQRVPITSYNNTTGQVVTYDSFVISANAQSGFKLHPIFIGPDGEELDYVLLSAYEGGLFQYNTNSYLSTVANSIDYSVDKLSSVANTKPVSGTSGLSLEGAETLAANRGAGWHMHTIAAESANQFLQIIEMGTMNAQSILGKGVCEITTTDALNKAALTGATASLGNTSGQASSTTLESNGSFTTTTTDGQLSVSYRGVENPYGNVWQMLNGILIIGNGATNGGVPYICTNYNYSYSQVTNNYINAGFILPNANGYIAALGYGKKDYDWVLMPALCNSNANSAVPVGDNGWFTTNLQGNRMVVQGGGWGFKENDGLFYYGCDKEPTDSTQKSYGARLLFIPTKNSIYTSNIAKWEAHMQ